MLPVEELRLTHNRVRQGEGRVIGRLERQADRGEGRQARSVRGISFEDEGKECGIVWVWERYCKYGIDERKGKMKNSPNTKLHMFTMTYGFGGDDEFSATIRTKTEKMGRI